MSSPISTNSSPIGKSGSWIHLGDYSSPRKQPPQTTSEPFISENPIDIESQTTLKDSIAAAIRSVATRFLPVKKKSEKKSEEGITFISFDVDTPNKSTKESIEKATSSVILRENEEEDGEIKQVEAAPLFLSSRVTSENLLAHRKASSKEPLQITTGAPSDESPRTPIDIESQRAPDTTLNWSIAAIDSLSTSVLAVKENSEKVKSPTIFDVDTPNKSTEEATSSVILRENDEEEGGKIKQVEKAPLFLSRKVTSENLLVQRKVSCREPLKTTTGAPSDESPRNPIDVITVIAIGVFLCSQVGFSLSKPSDSKNDFPITQVGFFITGVLSGLVATGKIIQWIKKN